MLRLVRIAAVLALSSMAFTAAAFALPGAVDPKAPCFRWPAVDYDGDGVYDRVDNCPNTKKGCAVDSHGCQYDLDDDGVCDGLDQCANTPKGEAADEHGCSTSQQGGARTAPPPPPPATEVERKLVQTGRIRLENIYFESETAKMLPESHASLDEVGPTLEKFPDLKIEVQGHTDQRGAASYNMKLSQSRAETVRAYLLAHFRLNPDNYVAKGYGETQPDTRERNNEELLRDRRVELKVLNPESLPRGVKVDKKN